jgi:hypothetical protein
VLRRVFGFAKVRYRGLKKNAHRLVVIRALANLFIACSVIYAAMWRNLSDLATTGCKVEHITPITTSPIPNCHWLPQFQWRASTRSPLFRHSLSDDAQRCGAGLSVLQQSLDGSFRREKFRPTDRIQFLSKLGTRGSGDFHEVAGPLNMPRCPLCRACQFPPDRARDPQPGRADGGRWPA